VHGKAASNLDQAVEHLVGNWGLKS